MEMTLLPMMDLTAPVLTESAPLGSGSVPAVGDSTVFAALLETATLGVEAMMIPSIEGNPQGVAPLPEMRQNGGLQEPVAGIIPPLAQRTVQNVLPTIDESVVDQLPLPRTKVIDVAADTESTLTVADLEPAATETEPASTREDEQLALATMAMASLASQQPPETVVLPAPQAPAPQEAVATVTAQQARPVVPALVQPTEEIPPPPGPVVVASPEPVRAANNALSQQGNQEVPAPAALVKNEPLRTPGKALPAFEQVTAPASTDSPAERVSRPEMVSQAEPQVSKPADTTRMVVDARIEALQATEPRKAMTSLPLNLAIEVTVAEPSSAVGAAAESGQFPGQNSQEQSTAPQQQMAQFTTQSTKSVDALTTAPAQPATLPISQDSLLEQVREHLLGRKVNLDGNQVRLKLNPAELGELQINLHMDDQRLRVEILTENKAVKAALLDNMDSLKDILARQHIAVERFDVGSGSSFGQFFREGNRSEEPSRPLPKFLHGNGFNPGSESGRTVAAWQPRSNALVDVRF